MAPNASQREWLEQHDLLDAVLIKRVREGKYLNSDRVPADEDYQAALNIALDYLKAQHLRSKNETQKP